MHVKVWLHEDEFTARWAGSAAYQALCSCTSLHSIIETALDSFTATVRVYTLHTIPLGLAAYQALRQASRERKAARASAAGAGAASVHPDARAVT